MTNFCLFSELMFQIIPKFIFHPFSFILSFEFPNSRIVEGQACRFNTFLTRSRMQVRYLPDKVTQAGSIFDIQYLPDKVTQAGSIFHFSIIPSFHPSKVPIYHFSIAELSNCPIIPLFHFSIVPFSNLPLFHHSILSFIQFMSTFTLPIQYSAVQYSIFNIPPFQPSIFPILRFARICNPGG